jgi:hypothetical protein
MRWSFNRLVDEFTPYREEEDLDFLEINQSVTRIACGDHV